jgi:hypothetical protein
MGWTNILHTYCSIYFLGSCLRGAVTYHCPHCSCPKDQRLARTDLSPHSPAHTSRFPSFSRCTVASCCSSVRRRHLPTPQVSSLNSPPSPGCFDPVRAPTANPRCAARVRWHGRVPVALTAPLYLLCPTSTFSGSIPSDSRPSTISWTPTRARQPRPPRCLCCLALRWCGGGAGLAGLCLPYRSAVVGSALPYFDCRLPGLLRARLLL